MYGDSVLHASCHSVSHLDRSASGWTCGCGTHSPSLLVSLSMKRDCILYIKVLTTAHLWATKWCDWTFRYWAVCVCGFSIHCITWCVPINGAVNIQTELEDVHQGELAVPLLFCGKLHVGIYMHCLGVWNVDKAFSLCGTRLHALQSLMCIRKLLQ